MRIEHWWYTLPLRFKSILRRGKVEHELDQEMQFHLDHLIEDGIAGGLSPQEARFAALRAMGGLEQRKEEARDMRRTQWATDFVDDVRYAIRGLRRTPGIAWFVVFTLALGIGMTSAPFSMLDSLTFRPYPVPDEGRVVSLVSTSRDHNFEDFSYREYRDICDHAESYDGVIANADLRPVGFSVTAEATPRVKTALMVSGNYFSVLRVTPQLGRAFRKDEDEVPGRDAVVVIGRDCWKQEFAGDRSVVGSTIRLNGRDFTVIGVAPESFSGMYIFARPDFYVPLAMAPLIPTHPTKNIFEDRDDRELSLKARLNPGVTREQAQEELAVIAQGFAREYPQFNRNRGAAVRTRLEMRTQADDIEWKFGMIFTILGLGVLLVACTNVAGLLLARAGTRTREIAVRMALGAGRSRVIRMLLTESLILAFLGGLGGVVVAYVAVELFKTFRVPTTLPITIPFQVDARVLLASLGLSVLSAILCGLAPAYQSTRADLVTGLKTADVDAPGRKRLWGRNLLVMAQVATSLMLLTASFLMVRGFRQTLGEASEFARIAQDRVLIASFDPRLVQYDAARTERFYQQLVERVRAVPGVQSAAFTHSPPLGLDGFGAVSFVPDGVDMPPDRETFTSTMDTIGEDYFETMGVPIVRGRGILASDTRETPGVVVVNQQFANHYWPGDEPIGKRLWLDGRAGTPVEVVGVAQTITYEDTGERPKDFVYVPLAQRPETRMVLLLRSDRDPLQLVEPLKDVVRGLDANMPIVEIRSYRDLYRYSAIEGPAMAIKLVGTMGAMALLLAIAGLYGLVAYNVSRRTREIGIRMAIGAQPADVMRMVMRKGLVLVAVGTVVGLAMGFALEQLMNSMLFNVGGVDVVAYAVVVPSMFLATLIAAYIPALKASRIAPTEALRYE